MARRQWHRKWRTERPAKWRNRFQHRLRHRNQRRLQFRHRLRRQRRHWLRRRFRLAGSGQIDRPLAAAKAAAFIAAMSLAAAPALALWRPDGAAGGAGFLVIFLTMIAGLVLYFTAGCAALRRLVPDYRSRLRLGLPGHAGETAIITGVCDIGGHAAVLAAYGPSPRHVTLIVVSLVFFLYPVYFLVTTLWTLQPEVRAVLAGRKRINTPAFANRRLRAKPARRRRGPASFTVSLAVHTEANAVIFATIRACQRAVAEYRRTTGGQANLVVSDDGLAKLLGAPLSAAALAAATGQAGERIAFYRREGVAFVARPLAGRQGKFKKAGNLNYTYGLARRLAAGADPAQLFAAADAADAVGSVGAVGSADAANAVGAAGDLGAGYAADADYGAYAGGWAEGDIVVHELICQLDKDSGLAPGVLAATAPEFAADPSLAFTQHVTRASNPDENYFTWLQARFTDSVYRVALPAKALQGLQVHLMGHSACLRRSFLEATGDWPEDRVSEDYAKALEAYDRGWHGKFIAYPDLDFSEQVCVSFAEEMDKQQRYCYGMSEVVLDCHPGLGAAKRADLFIHYLSYVNLAAALPVVLVLLLTHQIYYLFAGMLVNALIFLVLPVFQGIALKGALHLSRPAQAIRFFALNGLAFVGYSYTIATGHWAYYKDARRGSYEPFKATSVDQIEHSFRAGLGLLRGYARKHPPAMAAYLVIAVGCLTVLADQPPHPIRPLVAAFVLGHAIAPLALTPQLFVWPGRLSRANPIPADAAPATAPNSAQTLTAGQDSGSLLLSQEIARLGGKDGAAATPRRRRGPGSEHIRDAEPAPGRLARLPRRRRFH